MKNYLFLLVLTVFSQNTLALQCLSGNKSFEIHQCKAEALCVSDDQKEYTLDYGDLSAESVKCIDINFDGYHDILVNHPPSGHMKMSSVFVFNSTDNIYEKNEELSRLPCLEVNSEKKHVSGTCFSSSSCDRWSEQYSFRDGKLEITSIEGTYCDPATGTAYSYFESYSNGRVIEKKVEELVEQK